MGRCVLGEDEDKQGDFWASAILSGYIGVDFSGMMNHSSEAAFSGVSVCDQE